MAARRTRVALGLADQTVYSLTNFIVTLQVARHATAAEFGIYTLLMAGLLISSAVNRGMTAETVIVRHSASSEQIWRRAVETKLWVSLVFGEVLGLGILEITQHALPHEFGHLGLVFAVAPVVVFTQDFLRYAALAAARPGDALANDVAVVGVQLGGSALVGALFTPSPVAAVVVWVVATGGGLCVGLMRMRIVLRVPSRADLRADSGLAGRFAVDNLITQLSQQGVAYAVGATAGLAAAGGFRAAQTVFMPLAVLVLGVQSAIVPELVRARARSPHAMRRVTVRLAAAVGIGCSVYVVAAGMVPKSLGLSIFGDSWSEAAPLVIAIGVASVAGGIVNIAVAGLRAMADATRTLQVRWISVFVTVACVVPGAMLDGARGAAVGLIVSSWAQAALWWRQLTASWRADATLSAVHVHGAAPIRNRARTAAPASDGTA